MCHSDEPCCGLKILPNTVFQEATNSQSELALVMKIILFSLRENGVNLVQARNSGAGHIQITESGHFPGY